MYELTNSFETMFFLIKNFLILVKDADNKFKYYCKKYHTLNGIRKISSCGGICSIVYQQTKGRFRSICFKNENCLFSLRKRTDDRCLEEIY